MQNNENIKIDDLLDEVQHLKDRNEFLERCVKALKLNNAQTTIERNRVIEQNLELKKELCEIKQMSMFEFGNTYCTDKSLAEDGKRFARALLGGA